ncbi:MAG: 8-amino-7-oxononanoate synthase [Planctomycetota bacterium]
MSRPDTQDNSQQNAKQTLHRRLEAELAELNAHSLRRKLRTLSSSGKLVVSDGRSRLNLAGNDYLALSDHPAIKAAAAQAIKQDGVGSGASRLVAGHLDIHGQVEAEFAAFKHAEGALLFPTGYTANLAVLTALPQPGDLICQDKLNHASLIDAAKFSPAEVRTYPHHRGQPDHTKLARLLERHHLDHPEAMRWIVTDTVFSMDGDTADLPGLCDLAERFDAVVVVDEAHATGVLGDTGAGLAELQGVADRIAITISTASKALGSLGGIVTADLIIIDTLINRGRPFIYSTAVPPSQAAAIGAAIQVIREEPQRQERLQTLSQTIRDQLGELGWPNLYQTIPTPIIPLITGEIDAAMALQHRLEERGILAVAIRPPTVALGAARVRLSLRADLADEDLDGIVNAVGSPGRS